MQLNTILKRYFLLIERTARGHYPSFVELQEYLEDEGFTISSRTLQRDIDHIRHTFQLEIAYNRQRDGYYLDKDNSVNADAVLRFLEVLYAADVFSGKDSKGKKMLSYVMFEAEGSLRGSEYLKPLLEATHKKNVVRFMHRNFERNTTTEYCICPYLLKEYMNRWYVVGLTESKQEVRTFGLDRISELEIIKRTFIRKKELDPRKFFEHTIGLVYSGKKPVELVLEVTLLQAKYLETLPLHHSQKMISQTKTKAVFSLFVTPNFELIQKLLMMADQVKIIQPASLAKKMKDIYAHALKKYR